MFTDYSYFILLLMFFHIVQFSLEIPIFYLFTLSNLIFINYYNIYFIFYEKIIMRNTLF